EPLQSRIMSHQGCNEGFPDFRSAFVAITGFLGSAKLSYECLSLSGIRHVRTTAITIQVVAHVPRKFISNHKVIVAIRRPSEGILRWDEKVDPRPRMAVGYQ